MPAALRNQLRAVSTLGGRLSGHPLLIDRWLYCNRTAHTICGHYDLYALEWQARVICGTTSARAPRKRFGFLPNQAGARPRPDQVLPLLGSIYLGGNAAFTDAPPSFFGGRPRRRVPAISSGVSPYVSDMRHLLRSCKGMRGGYPNALRDQRLRDGVATHISIAR